MLRGTFDVFQVTAIGPLRVAFAWPVRYYELRPIFQLKPLVRNEIWMNRAFLTTTLCALLIVSGVCKAKVDNKDAIRDGVV